jgi:hypothetical protein
MEKATHLRQVRHLVAQYHEELGEGGLDTLTVLFILDALKEAERELAELEGRQPSRERRLSLCQ